MMRLLALNWVVLDLMRSFELQLAWLQIDTDLLQVRRSSLLNGHQLLALPAFETS
jgi:hypothetical protein